MAMKYWALKLTGILILIFILQRIFDPAFTNLFVLRSDILLSRPWTLFTSIFLHGSLSHLLLNGFGLALFGSILENYIGSKRFLILFFSSGLFASIFIPFFYSAALGASGAIFGVLGTLTYLKPKMTIWVNFLPMPLWIAAIYWTLENVLGIFIPDNIANLAHLSGLGFGLVFGYFIKEKSVKTKLKKRDDLMVTTEELEEWENKFIK
ncbi:MAG: rhomboid family intramembrane serine protease [Candidatus Woesearchaeota archaeon]